MTNKAKIDLGTLSDDTIADLVGKAILVPVCVEAKKRILRQIDSTATLVAEVERLNDELERAQVTMLDKFAMSASSGCDNGSPFQRATIAYRTAHEMMEIKKGASGKFVMHVIGPDDLFEYPDEITALRKANQHNIGFAKLMEEGGVVDVDPYCVAVVEGVD